MDDALRLIQETSGGVQYVAKKELDFLDYMFAGKRSSQLVQLSANVEELVREADSLCEIFSTDATVLLPRRTEAMTICAQAISNSTTATALRILTSKAASLLSASLLLNVESTLEFVDSQKISLPGDVNNRMIELQKKLKTSLQKFPCARAP